MRADLGDVVLNSGFFDARWYLETYPDVAASGLSPATHFARYGQWLGRGVSAQRPTAQQAGSLLEALRAGRRISYCIPIMNRGEDVKWTLRENIEANRPHQSDIEFVLLFLDEDWQTHDWVRREFTSELSNGYLRLVLSEPLAVWHFGRAKNRFCPLMSGDVYSSLDGDNFVTAQETAQLLAAVSEFKSRFVFHHFSGSWGDGTSGRISLPWRLYEAVRYDERFLPRQFDEVDLLLSVLVRYPGVTLVRYQTKEDIFSSKRVQDFLKDRPRLPPTTHIVESVARRSPANPRGANYIVANEKLTSMTGYNQFVCFWKNAAPSKRARFLPEIFRARRKVIDALDRNDLVPVVVSPSSHHVLPKVGPGELSLFCCVKNDEQFLPAFFRHYRNLGVRHFFVVDDNSDVPVHTILTHADVHVFRPEVGIFPTSKGLWLGALVKYFLEVGMWALTVDADEFLDLTPGFDTLSDVIAEAEVSGSVAVPAILLDMFPSRDCAEIGGRDLSASLDMFDGHALVGTPPDVAYSEHASLRWGFGPFARLSWALDIRYHAFGTFDSLRKVPLFRHRANLHLNQGFHDLHFTDKTPELGHELWARPTILPMRHYKTIKLFEEEMFRRTQAYAEGKSEAYHARTASNISKIFGGGKEQAIRALSNVPRAKYTPADFKFQVSRLLERNSA
jgi:hypothetical protein